MLYGPGNLYFMSFSEVMKYYFSFVIFHSHLIILKKKKLFLAHGSPKKKKNTDDGPHLAHRLLFGTPNLLGHVVQVAEQLELQTRPAE